MKKYIIGILCILTLIPGCVPQEKNNIQTLVPEVSSPEPKSFLTPTDNMYLAPNIIFDDNIQMEESCVKVSASFDVQPGGVVVLQDSISDLVTLHNLQTEQITSLGKIFPIMAVSPDHKKIAYSDDATGNIIVVNSLGQKIVEMESVPENWKGVVQWVSPTHLLLNNFVDKPFGIADGIVLNIFNETYEEHLSTFPDILRDIPPYRWGNFSYLRVVYSPDLTKVVYRGADQHGEPLLILWDIIESKQVAMFYQDYDDHIGGQPQWIDDGLSFVAGVYPQHRRSNTLYKNFREEQPYLGGHELSIIHVNGEIKRLTYFTTKYNAGQESFSLSPDKKYIAYWLNLNYRPADLYGERNLTIMDIVTGKNTNYCVDGGSMPTPAIWSPDGNYLMVTRYYVTGDILSDVILIDIRDLKAIQIGENVIARGWLIDEESE
jgi:hypothetical protein